MKGGLMTGLDGIDFAAISPLLIVLFGTLFLLFIETVSANFSKRWALLVAVATLALALGASFISPISESPLLTPWLKFDALARIFTIFFLLIGIATLILSEPFFQRFGNQQGEYYFLFLSALFGLLLIGASADFLTLLIGLETLSISLYILVGYMKKWDISSEAAIKYFFIGSIGAAFLLYGIALIYGAVGFTHFDGMLAAYQGLQTGAPSTLFLSGIALVTAGLCFKAAIVPFHTWAPDVYDGASTPVTAFMAIGTKVGAFAALTRVFFVALPHFNLIWNEGIAILAYLTLLYANYVAMRQTLLRRFFAYSGISHAGFLLIPFIAGTPDALSALLFYLVIYALATAGCFAVLSFLDHLPVGVTITDLRGLFHRSPFLAGTLAISLLTLAGIPPSAGFLAKFYLFKIAFESGYYLLVIVALLTTILSAYYYLRFIAVMFAERSGEESKIQHSWPAALLGTLVCSAILLLSFYPSPLMTLLSL